MPEIVLSILLHGQEKEVGKGEGKKGKKKGTYPGNQNISLWRGVGGGEQSAAAVRYHYVRGLAVLTD